MDDKAAFYCPEGGASDGGRWGIGQVHRILKLDDLVADHLERQLLQPERLEIVLATARDRREEHAERRREHRLCFKTQDRRRSRRKCCASSPQPPHRIRLEGGGYRRDHLRALAQRVEVADGEVRIMGSKSRLLQTLVAGSGVSSVPTQGLKWREGNEEGENYTYAIALLNTDSDG